MCTSDSMAEAMLEGAVEGLRRARHKGDERGPGGREVTEAEREKINRTLIFQERGPGQTRVLPEHRHEEYGGLAPFPRTLMGMR